MPLLAYCIAEAEAKIEIPHCGVQGKPIQTVAESGLISFVSEYSGAGDRNQVRGVAVEFNRVLQEVLQQAAIVPFQFPTMIADESEMRGFLREHAEKYLQDLRRLQDAVQMEVNLTADESPKARISGTDYLRARQARHHKFTATTEMIREALATWAKDWREHESSGGTRCYVLIPRDAVQTVLQRLQGIKLPDDLQARVTGPWPATEFLTRKS
jgi:gas vesicle protein GvpL/GvpF